MGPDGYPTVDYSGYAPGFTVDSKTLQPSTGFHGNVDVKTLHDWVKSIPGASPMPCPNAGTGRAIDAGEWVKWSKSAKLPRNLLGNRQRARWQLGARLPSAFRQG